MANTRGQYSHEKNIGKQNGCVIYPFFGNAKLLIIYLTPYSSIRFNRSLKSELTNIVAFHTPGMQDQFPCGVKARLRGLRVPECQVKRPVQLFQFPFSFYKIASHNGLPG